MQVQLPHLAPPPSGAAPSLRWLVLSLSPPSLQLLRGAQPGVRGALQRAVVPQVVLQWARQHERLAHHQPSGSGETQGSVLARRQSTGRHHPRVLQLWMQERVSPGVHPCQNRVGGGTPLPRPVRQCHRPEGHELGPCAMAPAHRRSLLPSVARQGASAKRLTSTSLSLSHTRTHTLYATLV